VQDPESEARECFLACDIGVPPLDSVWEPLDEGKCLGRPDARCAELGQTTDGVCVPTCGSDADCDGRVCHPALGVCVDRAPTAALGQRCNAPRDVCNGVCVDLGDGQSMCSSPCNLGGESLTTHDCGGIDHGICAIGKQASGLGDQGFCTNACTTHEECQVPIVFCFNVPGPPPDAPVLPKGFCLVAPQCPGGQADCDAQQAGLPCVDTAYGPYCVDPALFASAQ
jgi:hypothetical protein